MNKYQNKKTKVNGITFDSRAEAKRYQDLLFMQQAGHITGLTLQVPFVLAEPVKLFGEKRAKPALRFIADFVYTDMRVGGGIVVEDVKGVQTQVFKIKRHLMKTVHGIDVRVSK